MKVKYTTLILTLFILLFSIFGCNVPDTKTKETKEEPTQIANPASVYCVDNAGTLKIIDSDEGQIGICTLEDGTECEEWAYYRGECPQKASPQEPIVGGDKDEHGCIGSAGYTWCEEKSKCLRVWEEYCNKEALTTLAKGYCNAEDVYEVYTCADYIKVVSSLDGSGVTYHKPDKDGFFHEITCPVVAPDSMTEECKELTMSSNCVEEKIC